VIEQTLKYYPPPCELQKITNETIANCDGLDGRIDGVVSRTDLCTKHYNISATLGLPYSCPAMPGTFYSSPVPAANGTVSAMGIAVAQKQLDGLHTTDGRRAYFSYTPSSIFADTSTSYNTTTNAYELYISSLGGGYVEVLLNELNSTNLPNLDGVTSDTLVDWIQLGWTKFNDVLQTTQPDLTAFKAAGGKVIHFHGESDFSIPTASSVRYFESVRQIMNPGLSYNASVASTQEFYRLFLVPGASHCDTNVYQPNAPFPQTNLAVLIDWVEKGIAPATLNATVLLPGEDEGLNQQICAWPLRPLWVNNGTRMECVYDQESIDSWLYDLDAFLLPVY
jgi:tannase